MATKEMDVLAGAIAATEKELFTGAFDQEEAVHDDTDDRSREEMDGDVEDETDEVLASDEKDGGEELESEEDGDADAEGEDDQPRDGKGKFAAKDAAKDDDAKAKEAGAEKSDAADKVAGDGKVPSGRLREQTERAKTLEAERDAARAETAAALEATKALNARFDTFMATLQKQQQQPAKTQEPAKAEERPDLFVDPEGFVTHITKGFQSELSKRDQQFEAFRVETSMQSAEGRHGETFGKAYAALIALDRNNPDDVATVRRVWASPNPGEALVRWHRNNETLREVGDDPGKFKERIANETREALMKDPEFREQLLQSLRDEAGTGEGGRPRTAVRIPKSLNGAAGGRSASNDDVSDDGGDLLTQAFSA